MAGRSTGISSLRRFWCFQSSCVVQVRIYNLSTIFLEVLCTQDTHQNQDTTMLISRILLVAGIFVMMPMFHSQVRRRFCQRRSIFFSIYAIIGTPPKSSKTNSPCNGKSSYSNGSVSSSCQKSELLRPSIVKPNGVFSSKNNVSSVLKNGKVSLNPQIKAISIKNLEVKKVIANGNGNIVVHNNGCVGNNGYNKLSPSGKKSTPLPENGSGDNGALGNNGYNRLSPSGKKSTALPENVSGDNGALGNNGYNRLSPSGKKSTVLPENGSGDNAGVCTNGYNKLSPSGKKSTPLPENGSGENSKVFQKIKVSPTSKSNVAGGNSSLENGRKKKLSQVPNGNNCINPWKKELHEKATQDGEGVREQHCNNLSNNVINKTYGTTSASKRKSSDTKRPKSSKFCTQDRTPGDLEKFKEVIATEASSYLRSCGWFDRVHDFMSVRKRRCTQVTGSCPDETELRKQLIMDAGKNFLSQIPESLKESLIERLKSFSETNALLGS
ncbi:putative ubiquitin carboxyl-terminal hydrolase 25 [Iris pallida]|uniref:Ubiquitin carboxyl-terminal hydrolase 25 n=1 Tax=Iris pallida TaxID=29817 RepID=A0AAX6HYR3_IRIPA|nr:putative ubiquitin carboxyl-terminal hydrolase 25 [Iris pallida]